MITFWILYLHYHLHYITISKAICIIFIEQYLFILVCVLPRNTTRSVSEYVTSDCGSRPKAVCLSQMASVCDNSPKRRTLGSSQEQHVPQGLHRCTSPRNGLIRADEVSAAQSPKLASVLRMSWGAKPLLLLVSLSWSDRA